jgi:hypothetical protein
MLPEVTLQGAVWHDETQRIGDLDSGDLELMLWWYCMAMHVSMLLKTCLQWGMNDA